MDIAYYEARFQSSIKEASSATDSCARRTHQDFARLYREKLKVMRDGAQVADASERAGLITASHLG
jgi:hypothetical protein